jgi:hypothetical protein
MKQRNNKVLSIAASVCLFLGLWSILGLGLGVEAERIGGARRRLIAVSLRPFG